MGLLTAIPPVDEVLDAVEKRGHDGEQTSGAQQAVQAGELVVRPVKVLGGFRAGYEVVGPLEDGLLRKEEGVVAGGRKSCLLQQFRKERRRAASVV